MQRPDGGLGRAGALQLWARARTSLREGARLRAVGRWGSRAPETGASTGAPGRASHWPAAAAHLLAGELLTGQLRKWPAARQRRNTGARSGAARSAQQSGLRPQERDRAGRTPRLLAPGLGSALSGRMWMWLPPRRRRGLSARKPHLLLLGWLVALGGLPAASGQSCVAGPPPAGYLASSPDAATATTVDGLGAITCEIGYFSASLNSIAECPGDGQSFVYSNCAMCNLWAHIINSGGGTCNCNPGDYGTGVTDPVTLVTDCTPCLENSGTAPPPPGAERTDNTNPSSCHCWEGYAVGGGHSQVPQSWELTCSVPPGETRRSRVNACRMAGEPYGTESSPDYRFSGTEADCSAAHSSCVYREPDACRAVPCPPFSSGYTTVWEGPPATLTACTCFAGYYGGYISAGSTTHPVWDKPTNSYGVVCNLCTPVDNAAPDATYTCSTADDSRVSACDSGFYKVGGDVGAADTCPACTGVTNAAAGATYTCTSAADSRVSGCASGFYKLPGGPGAADVCPPCTTISDVVDGATYTCTTAVDSRVSACASGFWKLVGGTGSADTCVACTVVVDAEEDATYTCTSGTDSRVSACRPGFYRSEGTSGSMDTCTGERCSLRVLLKLRPPAARLHTSFVCLVCVAHAALC